MEQVIEATRQTCVIVLFILQSYKARLSPVSRLQSIRTLPVCLQRPIPHSHEVRLCCVLWLPCVEATLFQFPISSDELSPEI